MNYKIVFIENGKKRQATIMIPSWEIKEGESKENAVKRIIEIGSNGPVEVKKISRASSGRLIEGIGNPRKYK